MAGAAPRGGFSPGLALVLLTAVISGVSTFVNGFAVVGTSSNAFVTVRNLAVAGMILPVALLARRWAPAGPPLRGADRLGLVVVGIFGGAIPFLLFFHGLALAQAEGSETTASFVYRTLFVFASIFAILFLRERLGWRLAVGGILLLAGSYVLLTLTSPTFSDGSLYVLAATVLWAGEYTLSKHLLRRIPSSTVALARMGIGGIALAAYLLVTSGWGAVAAFSATEWTWVAISAVLLAGFVATWYSGLARIDLSLAASVLVLGYPVTWLLSVVVRPSTALWTAAAGAGAVVVGLGVVLGAARAREFGAWLLGRSVPAAPST
jgi:drug/metabolite transporter (DMT)-like permease